MEWIKEVSKYHNDWVRIMRHFGAGDFSEDYVQDMYIKIAEKSNEEKAFQNGKLNKSYIYFILRNTYIMNERKQRINSEKVYRKHQHFNSFEKRKYEENFFSDPGKTETEMLIKKNLIMQKMLAEISSWHWYDSWLFNIYVNSEKSIRTMARESGISFFSIFNTLKNCKERIKLAIGEDWEDFNNKEYERINEIDEDTTK